MEAEVRSVRCQEAFLWLYGLGIYRTIYFFIQSKVLHFLPWVLYRQLVSGFPVTPALWELQAPVLATLNLFLPFHTGQQQIPSRCLWAVLQRRSFTIAKPAEMVLGVGSSIALAWCPLALVVRISRRNPGCASPSKSPQEIGWVGKGALCKGSLDDFSLWFSTLVLLEQKQIFSMVHLWCRRWALGINWGDAAGAQFPT